MSAMMSQPPPSAPPIPPPSGPPPQQGSPWTDEMIQQVCQDTGYSPERVKADIERTGATSPGDLYPNLYSGAGIQPQQPLDGQMASEGVVQGQPPEPTAAPPVAAPAEAGGAPQPAPMEAAEGGATGIDPQVAQAMHSQMAPSKYRRRGR